MVCMRHVGLLLLTAMVFSTNCSVAKADTVVFHVPRTGERTVDTGIRVKPGYVLRFSASGMVEWTDREGRNHTTGPNGLAGSDFLAPGCTELGLVARIAGHVFGIGSGKRIASLSGGELQLAMNETPGGWSDNLDSWRVNISVYSPDGRKTSLRQDFYLDSAKMGWQDTGIAVPAGVDVYIKATGKVRDWTSPDGSEEHWMMPRGRGWGGCATGSLYGMVNYSQGDYRFAIGERRQIRIPHGVYGTLELRIADVSPKKVRSGSWKVTVSVEPSQ